jgi:hypothetical protein
MIIIEFYTQNKIETNADASFLLENLEPGVKGDLAGWLNAEVCETHFAQLSRSLCWLTAVHSSAVGSHFSKLVQSSRSTQQQ